MYNISMYLLRFGYVLGQVIHRGYEAVWTYHDIGVIHSIRILTAIDERRMYQLMMFREVQRCTCGDQYGLSISSISWITSMAYESLDGGA